MYGPWSLKLPFMPPGEGGLILILGGVSMLSFALLLLTLIPPRMPTGAPGRPEIVGSLASRMRQLPGSSDASSPYGWQRALRRSITRTGLAVTVAMAETRQCVVVVGECRSCIRGRATCAREQHVIQRSIRRCHLVARVEEICCSLRGEPRCAFAVVLEP